MNDAERADSRLTRSLDRLRRAHVALDGTPLRDSPDVETALSSCIRTEDRAAARELARSWLAAAGRAADDRRPDGAALTLLARVFAVPADYFTDADTAAAVDDHLPVAADAAGRGVTSYGPCRGGVPGVQLGAVAARLLRELQA